MSRPRIRSIKPEIWQSRDFLALSTIGRLTFICLLSNADDEGRLKTDAAHLSRVFIGEPVDLIDRQLERMEELGMLVRYGRDHGYVALINWPKHQKIDKAKDSMLPEPPSFTKGAARMRTRRVARRTQTSRKSQIELDFSSTRRELSTLDPDPDPDPDQRTPSLSTNVDPVILVFEAWKTSTGRNGHTQLDEKRKRAIVQALKRYPLHDVIDAVEGWRMVAHNRGENDRHRPYNELTLLLRDADHIERFRDAHRGLDVTAGRKSHLELSVESDLQRAAQLRLEGN